MTDNITREKQLRGRIKAAIIITIIGLLLNGMSSLPLRTELDILLRYPNRLPQFLLDWWTYVQQGVVETSEKYNFMRYGFDWLAFAHLMIAIAFIGPLRDPVKNQWVIKWGMIVAAMSILMAFGWERMRNIPVWWSIIDAGISYVAFVVLWLCNRWIEKLKVITSR
ncbi:MAG TPA: hypothetical protein VE978_09775 [Chitinophagales bacterium]|nr:hypothetical protein [Chitinophagales bacterium]